MEKYVAQIKTSRQISPDDWELWTPTIEVGPDTTLTEILDGFRSLKVHVGELDQISIHAVRRPKNS
jgi:hypothetical protein